MVEGSSVVGEKKGWVGGREVVVTRGAGESKRAEKVA